MDADSADGLRAIAVRDPDGNWRKTRAARGVEPALRLPVIKFARAVIHAYPSNLHQKPLQYLRVSEPLWPSQFICTILLPQPIEDPSDLRPNSADV